MPFDHRIAAFVMNMPSIIGGAKNFRSSARGSGAHFPA
jgi:hypothetical protein